MAEVPSPVPLDAGRLNAELESLRAEVGSVCALPLLTTLL